MKLRGCPDGKERKPTANMSRDRESRVRHMGQIRMSCLHITCHTTRRLELANSFKPFSRLSPQVASKRTSAILPDLPPRLHYEVQDV